jgi:Acetyl-CoA hydrolase/transferase N-terminal domain
MPAEDAAAFIAPGDHVGMSGFTGSGHPKAVPAALVARVTEAADRVILEVNSWQPAELEGIHDIYHGSALPPHRTPIPILTPSDRIGVPYLHCPPEKIIAVVPTHDPDYSPLSRSADGDSQLIAGHVLDFLTHEVRRGRLPATLPPLQSGVGNITNAVLAGLDGGGFPPLTAYTEVVQDGMLRLLRSGAMTVASATGFSLSEDGIAELHAGIGGYRDRADGQPCRPHRARRACHHHRAGHRRPARLAAATPRPADHRPLRAPRLPAGPAGLPRPGHRHRARQAHPAPARRGIVVARTVPARRHHASALKRDGRLGVTVRICRCEACLSAKPALLMNLCERG